MGIGLLSFITDGIAVNYNNTLNIIKNKRVIRTISAKYEQSPKENRKLISPSKKQKAYKNEHDYAFISQCRSNIVLHS